MAPFPGEVGNVALVSWVLEVLCLEELGCRFAELLLCEAHSRFAIVCAAFELGLVPAAAIVGMSIRLLSILPTAITATRRGSHCCSVQSADGQQAARQAADERATTREARAGLFLLQLLGHTPSMQKQVGKCGSMGDHTR